MAMLRDEFRAGPSPLCIPHLDEARWNGRCSLCLMTRRSQLGHAHGARLGLPVLVGVLCNGPLFDIRLQLDVIIDQRGCICT